MLVSNFRELRVWQAGMDLVEQTYKLTQGFPTREMYGLSSQMQRASVSVPSNIAEGHTREHIKEYLHHVSMAQASLAELETQVEIAGRLDYISASHVKATISATASLRRQLYALRNGLRDKS